SLSSSPFPSFSLRTLPPPSLLFPLFFFQCTTKFRLPRLFKEFSLLPFNSALARNSTSQPTRHSLTVRPTWMSWSLSELLLRISTPSLQSELLYFHQTTCQWFSLTLLQCC